MSLGGEKQRRAAIRSSGSGKEQFGVGRVPPPLRAAAPATGEANRDLDPRT